MFELAEKLNLVSSTCLLFSSLTRLRFQMCLQCKQQKQEVELLSKFGKSADIF